MFTPVNTNEFRNVSLRLGQKTLVKVIPLDGASGLTPSAACASYLDRRPTMRTRHLLAMCAQRAGHLWTPWHGRQRAGANGATGGCRPEHRALEIGGNDPTFCPVGWRYMERKYVSFGAPWFD